MLALNTSRPLFSDPRVRRAVAYAVDRRALAAEESRYRSIGATGGGSATDAYLPRSMGGAPAGAVYPFTPDLARARALMAGRRGKAVLYTCNKAPCPQEAAIIGSNLRAIGIDVEVHAFPKPLMYALAARRGAPFDILSMGWFAADPDPNEFLRVLDGRAIGPRDNSNFSYFDDPAFNRKLAVANRQFGAARCAAFSGLAVEVARTESPLVVYGVDESRDFCSSRIGCEVYQPVYGMDLATLCAAR